MLEGICRTASILSYSCQIPLLILTNWTNRLTGHTNNLPKIACALKKDLVFVNRRWKTKVCAKIIGLRFQIRELTRKRSWTEGHFFFFFSTSCRYNINMRETCDDARASSIQIRAQFSNWIQICKLLYEKKLSFLTSIVDGRS